MKIFKAAKNNSIDVERFSRRWVNDVEILEHETLRSACVNNLSEAKTIIGSCHRQPKLVISNPIEDTRNFISKARSDLGEVDNIFRNALDFKTRYKR